MGDIYSQIPSDWCGPAVGVLVVVFSERAALEEIPLRVEQPTHAATRFAARIARFSRVQRVHGHLGGGRPRVAALSQRRRVSARGLGGAHARAAAESVAVGGHAAEGGLLYELGAGLGAQLAVLLDEHVHRQHAHHFRHYEGEGTKVEGPAVRIGLLAVTLTWISRIG